MLDVHLRGLLLPCLTVSALPPRQGQCVHRADRRPMTGMWPTYSRQARQGRHHQNLHLLGLQVRREASRGREPNWMQQGMEGFVFHSARTTILPIVRGPSGHDAVENRRWNQIGLLNLENTPAPLGAERGRVYMGS